MIRPLSKSNAEFNSSDQNVKNHEIISLEILQDMSVIKGLIDFPTVKQLIKSGLVSSCRSIAVIKRNPYYNFADFFIFITIIRWMPEAR